MRTFKQYTVFAAIAVIITLVAALLPIQAQAQAVGNTEVRVVVPPVLILYYYSVLIVELDPTAINAEQAVDRGTANVTLTPWTADAAITTGTPAGTLTNGTATIQNAWGYWAVGGSRNMQAVVTEGAAAALSLELGTGSVVLSNFSLTHGAASGATIAFAGPATAGTGAGDLQFDVDLSNVADAGTYQDNANGPQFTIALTYL